MNTAAESPSPVVGVKTTALSRLFGTLFAFGAFFLFFRDTATEPALAWTVIVLALANTVWVFLIHPRRIQAMSRTNYGASAVDIILLILWVYATGGVRSPFLPFYHLVVAGAVFRNGVRRGFGFAALLSASLLVFLAVSGRPRELVPAVVVQSGVLFLLAFLCAQVAAGLRRQIQGRIGSGDMVQDFGNRSSELARENAETQARLRAILAQSGDLLWEYDPSSPVFAFVGPGVQATLGYPDQRWLNEPGFALGCVHPEDRPRLEALRLQAARDGKPFEAEYRVFDARGNEIWLKENVHYIPGAGGQAARLRGLARDVTFQRRAEAAVRHQSHHDALTGLPNRPLFMDRLTVALSQARRLDHMVAVLVVNLDRFKSVNDTSGYGAGDEILRQTAERLGGRLKEGDTLARLGADEFGLILTRASDSRDVAAAAESVHDAFHAPFLLGDREVHVGASLGVSLFPSDGDDAETLLKCADVAVTDAKEAGRGGHRYYSPALNAQTLQHLAMESSLRRALKEREFMVHYQPQVDLRTGRLCGAEALIRWRHPELGLVFPSEFIAAAESSGLIGAIGEAMIREACARWKAWADAGLAGCRLFVNLSARQFHQEDVVTKISATLSDTGLPPGLLGLEITESVAMKNVRYTRETLARLHDRGLEIALDDFGTGYSSLSYLKLFPIHLLKIDKSFVRDLGTDANDEAIARAIISLAGSLKLRVLAEGVEGYAQQEFLRKNGCDLAQGYLYERPLPPAEFERFLRNPVFKTASALGATIKTQKP